MARLDNDPIYAQAVLRLAEAQQRARDLEGFVRVYPELVGSAFAMPTEGVAEPEARPVLLDPEPRPRPEVSLADPELSISDAAAKVLRHRMRPMRARELAETMMEWGFEYPNSVQDLRASVGGVLAREVREGGIFTKQGKGVFGLTEWGDAVGDDDGDDEGGDGLEGGERTDPHPLLQFDDNPFAPQPVERDVM